MSTALQTLTNKLAERFEMGSSENLTQTLIATAFKGQKVSNEQMTALLIVANQYELNPWTNEIYAYPSNGAIIPIVGVDGWYSIINKHPQFDGIEFEQDESSCTCRIYRKDRQRPTVVTEYLSECKRNTNPWNSHPKRMLRHKAAIQCARVAFSLSGIYEPDEAERISESEKSSGNATAYTAQNTPQSASSGQPNHPEFRPLVEALENVAKQGVEALKLYLKEELSKEQRSIVGSDEMLRLKEMAQAYEQGNLQDAEYTEA